MPQVLVTARSFRQLPGDHWNVLREFGCEILTPDGDRPFSEAEMIPLVGEADAVIVGVDSVTARVIGAAPHLKVISKHGVGVDNIDIAAATRAGIVVTNVPSGGNQVAVAELTVGLILSLTRRIPYHDNLVKSGAWSRRTGTELADKTIGFIGLGRIAKEVVLRLHGFGMQFQAYDIYEDHAFASEHFVHFTTLDELLASSDVISLHAALTAGSRYLIGEAELAKMKPNAFLINTARGNLVDEDALCKALIENRLAGAAIDTPSREPPAGSSLLKLGEKVILTPHIGAQTEEAIQRVGLMAARNVIAVLHGDKPEATVNPEVYVLSNR